MRTLNLESEIDDIIHLLNIAKEQEFLITCWQSSAAGDERKVFQVAIAKIDINITSFKIYSTENKMFEIEGDFAYFYIPALQCIFRSKIINLELVAVDLLFPEEIKILEDEADKKIQQGFNFNFNKENEKRVLVKGFLPKESKKISKISNATEKIETKWKGGGPLQLLSVGDNKLFEQEIENMSLEEEDQIFAQVRVDPRARAREEKKINISKMNSDDAKTYALFDLSRSGFSFIIDGNSPYNAQSYIKIHGFDNNNFEAPMIAQVMNLRPLEDQSKSTKVGCRFLSQQELEELA